MKMFLWAIQRNDGRLRDLAVANLSFRSHLKERKVRSRNRRLGKPLALNVVSVVPVVSVVSAVSVSKQFHLSQPCLIFEA